MWCLDMEDLGYEGMDLGGFGDVGFGGGGVGGIVICFCGECGFVVGLFCGIGFCVV